MTRWQAYLKLLHYLCNIPSFNNIIPIVGTRSTHVTVTSDVVQGIGVLPGDEATFHNFCKQISIHKGTTPPVYLTYKLNIPGRNEAISFLALPVVVDRVDSDAGYYSLKPNCDLPVLFNTSHLHSEGKSLPDTVLGSEQQYIDFKKNNLPPLTDDWQVWHDYAMQMVEAVTGKSLFELNTFLGGNSQFVYRLDAELAIHSGADKKAIRSILDLYDALFYLDEGAAQKTPLYRAIRVHDGEKPVQATENDSLVKDIRSNHSYLLGHMDEQNADQLRSLLDREMRSLDNSQRLVLEKLSRCKDGDALAVNGPPGSGKTAMLKAVVADQWVRAAFNKDACPIILAVGATNQSVTNIISAFPKVPYSGTEPPPPFLMHYKRWIPCLNGYGTYFPSKSELEKIVQRGDDKTSILGKVSSSDATTVLEWQFKDKPMSDYAELKHIKKYYIDHASVHFERHFDSGLAQIVDACHQRLKDICVLTETILKHASPKNMSRLEGIQHLLDITPLMHGQRAGEETHSRKQATEIAQDLVTLFQSEKHLREPILLRVMRERIFDEKIVLSDLDNTNYEEFLYEAKILLLDGLLDLTLRAEAFHYAARYWEGVYIAECEQEILITRTKSNVEKGLRRACMLTPCLVSTLNSAPNLFSLAIARNRFLLGQVDLLIMDESGQAQQRIGIPLLALAKKALIVGDVEQLQPVISDLTVGDEAYAYSAFGYSQDQFTEALSKGLSCTTGSILQLMRHASRFSHQGLGLMLRGHYRCQSNIIQFCNEMVYDNKLMLLPHNSVERGPLPSFSWVHSSFKNGRNGSSRYSVDEAKYMIEFLLKRWDSIYEFYRAKDTKNNRPERTAADLIAIVTPFTAQARAIRRAFKVMHHQSLESGFSLCGFPSEDIDAMKIGTVDSLQGAEKPIVLFSGVHGAFESGGPYFKDQPFLLNVAVSRAQDCFVAFICEETYGVHEQIAPEQLPQIRRNSARYLGYYLGQSQNEHKVRRCERLFPRRLVVIEAKGKVKSLGGYLGPEYLVLDSQGSITEYAAHTTTYDQLVATGFRPSFQLKPNGVELIDAIKAQLAMVDEVILATDDDYVGETIAWHIYMQFRDEPKAQEKFTRVRLGAMTSQEISRAFKLKETEAHDAFVRALPAEQGIIERRKFLQQRDCIDSQRVKAEVFRQLIDHLIRGQFKKMGEPPVNETAIAKELGSGLIHVVSNEAMPSAMGRVRIAILSLLAQDVRSKLALIENNHCEVYLHAAGERILGHIESTKRETRENMLQKISTFHKNNNTNTYMGDCNRWRLEPTTIQTMHESAPDASTMEIVKLASTRLGIKPNITMQLLQALYLGDF